MSARTPNLVAALRWMIETIAKRTNINATEIIKRDLALLDQILETPQDDEQGAAEVAPASKGPPPFAIAIAVANSYRLEEVYFSQELLSSTSEDEGGTQLAHEVQARETAIASIRAERARLIALLEGALHG